MLKENLPYTEIPLNTNLQAIAVKISTPFACTICNVYLPNFDWELYDLQHLVSSLPTPFLLVGDFNAHNPIWGSNHRDARGHIIENLLDNSNIILLNTGTPTCLSARSGELSAIDLSFSSPDLAIRFEWKTADNLYGSDHLPIHISTNIPNKAHNVPQKWLLNRADWEKFRDSLKPPTPSNDITEYVDRITSCIVEAAQLSIPRSNGKIPRSPVPWWNGEVSEAIAKKKRAFNVFRRNPSNENLICFKRLRAQARRLILESKRSSWKLFVEDITVNTPTADVWKKVRAISGYKFPSVASSLSINDRSLTDDKDIVEALATQFETTSSSQNYDPIFRDSKNDREIPLNFSDAPQHAYNAPFTMRELEEVFKESKDTSPGPDGIPNKILRNLSTPLKVALLDLYNRIWTEGNYPEQWKEAIIVPLAKQGKDPRLPSSYRPISLTCCLSKILEKMVNKRLQWYLESNSLIAEYQSGFRKNHSTLDHLVNLEHNIQNAFLKREHLVAIFFDLERAFDMTWRYGIVEKVYRMGLRGNLPKFIQSFLTDRRFKVRVGDTLSTKRTLENGVPQGSTLSVLLFAIAVNDIANDIPAPINKCLYVDDLVIYISGATKVGLLRQLQQGINKVVENAEGRGFKFSSSKTACVHFCRLRRPHREPQIYLKETAIQCLPEIKFLGIIFDSKLTWSPHIESVIVKCKKALNIIKCLSGTKWGADRDILISLYKSLVLSRIDYGCIAYSSARYSILKKLDTVHHLGIRYATGAFPTSPVSSLYCESSIPPLRLRREQLLLKYVSRIRAQPAHNNYNILFNARQHQEYINRPTVTRPSDIRAREILIKYNITLPRVFPVSHGEYPPWIIPQIKIRLDLSINRKDETPPIIYRTHFMAILSEYHDALVIYTDGSKTENGTGCAILASGETHAWSFHKYASIYTAELYAIWKATLLCCESEDYNNFLICSDSLSALNSLASPLTTTNPLVHLIYSSVIRLHQIRKYVTFVWVPGHTGIEGNSTVDTAARNAAENMNPNVTYIMREDLSNALASIIDSQWQQEWNETTSKLRETKPNIQKWRLPSCLKRNEQVTLTRLRIGHTRLTSSYLLAGEDPPLCQHCNERLTVKHILETCECYEQARERCLLRGNVGQILTNKEASIKAVLNFCRISGLLGRI